jgi:glycerol-3-phosphate dehydrogenase
METLSVDVAIVGAGVVGCSIAARLSLEDVTVLVLERRHDVADETSKSNTGLADSGWECEPGTLEAKLVCESSRRWEEIAARFDTPFRRCGALSLARSEADLARLDTIRAAATKNGVRTTVLSREETLARAPYVHPDVRGSIEAPDEGIVDSIRLTLGYAELAAQNGTRFVFNEPLLDADVGGGKVVELRTPGTRVRPRFVVNAAGLGADAVSRALRAEEFDVWPRRGEYLLVDREVGRKVTQAITQLPNAHTRGVMVVPSTHGSLLLGPTALDDDDKNDRSTHTEVLTKVLAECRALVPDLHEEHIIKSYAGLRPASDRTYRVEQSQEITNLIQACGIRSTGISSSPALGEYVRELLAELGLRVRRRSDARERIPHRPRLADEGDCEELARDPLGRTVICACEKVTALEIHNALRSVVPARSIAGVAKRTRVTWGRCQGAACLSGVAFITSLYVGKAAWQIPWGEPAATLGVAEARHV